MIGRQTSIEPSPALLAAQDKLETLRKQTQAERGVLDGPGSAGKGPTPTLRPAEAQVTPAELGQLLLVERRRREAAAQGLRASDALRAYLQPESSKSKWPPAPGPQERSRPESDKEDIGRSFSTQEETVKIYPSLALAMLQTERAATGRVYWLLKYLDKQGRGWLDVGEVRLHLTNKKSPLRVCGWRRLRQIFSRGEGLFWTRDRAGRLWIKGPARVGLALGCERLKGKPISLPVTALLGGIKQVRAHFYGSHHSSRREKNPIARSTLRVLTGIPERTQRQYDQVADVSRKRNVAIGERYSEEAMEERAWRKGQAAFRFIDLHGKQGAPGREYVAWHIPNSYDGPHSQRCKGRQKKINRQLRDLVMKGMQGNGRDKVERLFWTNGAAAGKAYNRNSRVDAYWPRGRSRASQYILWGVVSGRSR